MDVSSTVCATAGPHGPATNPAAAVVLIAGKTGKGFEA
jgi:hypothetical protein